MARCSQIGQWRKVVSYFGRWMALVTLPMGCLPYSKKTFTEDLKELWKLFLLSQWLKDNMTTNPTAATAWPLWTETLSSQSRKEANVIGVTTQTLTAKCHGTIMASVFLIDHWPAAELAWPRSEGHRSCGADDVHCQAKVPFIDPKNHHRNMPFGPSCPIPSTLTPLAVLRLYPSITPIPACLNIPWNGRLCLIPQPPLAVCFWNSHHEKRLHYLPDYFSCNLTYTALHILI